MTWLRHTLCWLLLACVLAGGEARAHASLIETTPTDGAVVATAPASVRLRFNEPVSPLVLRLIDASGTAHADLHHEARNDTITVHLPEGLPQGTHVLSYRVTSSDGHPIGGSLVFSIGTPTAGPAQQTAANSPLAVTIWLTRLALYLGLFAGAGGAFFVVWIGQETTTPASRTVVRTAIGTGIAAALLSAGLQGLDALGEPFAALLLPHPWHAALTTSFGLTAGVAILALMCAWLALRGKGKPLVLVGLAGAGLALALSGHASAAAPQWLTRPTVFVHGMAAAFWIGALAPLALIVRDLRSASLPILQRFSALAVPAVGLMVLTGLVLSIVQLETPASLLTTDYGRIFLAKMAAVVCLLTLAILNRQWLTPLLGSKGAGSRYLVRSIAGEIGLTVTILGLVATWRFTPPPRALMAPPEPVRMHIHTPAAMAELTLTPGRAGPAAATIVLMTGDFGALDPKEVTVTLAKPDAGIEPIERRAVKTAESVWQVQGLVLPIPGPWQLRVDVLVSDFEKVTLENTIEIRP
ncbi:copper resistance CopC/CopD family protein [Microvirga makkahensis]|uniref:Copper resistance protein CopC n=1 Tax=Microvirga makkahensis TaxID=1128670 RepID=A0A7X3MVN8_9HYPH|nr:copper resistance protein CopC [Microvirga makkahensis]MXQ14026.1 copper resistance protein CopC [Microvirga makkahensis]